MAAGVHLLEVLEHLGQVQVLHVDVGVLEVLVEGADAVEDVDVVDGDFEEFVRQVLEQEGAHVFLRVGRDQELLVVQLPRRRTPLPPLLLLRLLPLPLLLALPAHSIITPPTPQAAPTSHPDNPYLPPRSPLPRTPAGTIARVALAKWRRKGTK